MIILNEMPLSIWLLISWGRSGTWGVVKHYLKPAMLAMHANKMVEVARSRIIHQKKAS